MLFCLDIAKLDSRCGDVCSDMLSLLFHYLLNVDFFVSKPTEVVCNQMKRVATFTADENNTFFITMFTKSAGLLRIAFAAGVSK